MNTDLQNGPYDFANILFAGPCNAHCPCCIGKQLDSALNEPNLQRFPPKNLGGFIQLLWQNHIKQVTLTGTTTDPQLYRYEERLIEQLRKECMPGTQLSLHTNGLLAQRKINVFNQYDRVSLSFPSFNSTTYRKMMGLQNVLCLAAPPNLEAILAFARVPVKISCLVTDDNAPEIPSFLVRCHSLGIRRLALRKLYGDHRPWSSLLPAEISLHCQGTYRNNAVYDWSGMQVTMWDFTRTKSTSLNLFSNGLISSQYLFVETQNLASRGANPIFDREFRKNRVESVPQSIYNSDQL